MELHEDSSSLWQLFGIVRKIEYYNVLWHRRLLEPLETFQYKRPSDKRGRILRMHMVSFGTREDQINREVSQMLDVMERIGGLATFFELFILSMFIKVTKPFRDLNLAQSFYTSKKQIFKLKSELHSCEDVKMCSASPSFKLRWCLLRTCCQSKCCRS